MSDPLVSAHAKRLAALDAPALEPLVGKLLGVDGVRVSRWRVTEIRRTAVNPVTMGLYKVRGIASARAGRRPARPFSLILKTLRRAEVAARPSDWNYWRRELDIYRSGYLERLPPSLRAPRLLGSEEPAPGLAWLWLEELPRGGRWSGADYAVAAFELGRLNGTAAVEQWPRSRVLSRGWLESLLRSTQPGVDVFSDLDVWKLGALRRLFEARATMDALLDVRSRAAALLGALRALPHTVCHLDAFRPNLFRLAGRGGSARLALIDWSMAGVGAVGEDLAHLYAGTLLLTSELAPRRADAFRERLVRAYCAGLRKAGLRTSLAEVNLGFVISVLLRTASFAWFPLGLLANEERTAWRGWFGKTVSEWAPSYASALEHLLGFRREAARLLSGRRAPRSRSSDRAMMGSST